MAANPPELRAGIGCGYLPPREGARVWQAPMDADIEQWSVCPGYTTSLPETIDIARGWVHWSRGELASFCDGPPCDPLVMGVEVMAGTLTAFENYTLAERTKRGAK